MTDAMEQDHTFKHTIIVKIEASACQEQPFNPLPILERMCNLMRKRGGLPSGSAIEEDDIFIGIITNCPLVVPRE